MNAPNKGRLHRFNIPAPSSVPAERVSQNSTSTSSTLRGTFLSSGIRIPWRQCAICPAPAAINSKLHSHRLNVNCGIPPSYPISLAKQQPEQVADGEAESHGIIVLAVSAKPLSYCYRTDTSTLPTLPIQVFPNRTPRDQRSGYRIGIPIGERGSGRYAMQSPVQGRQTAKANREL